MRHGYKTDFQARVSLNNGMRAGTRRVRSNEAAGGGVGFPDVRRRTCGASQWPGGAIHCASACSGGRGPNILLRAILRSPLSGTAAVRNQCLEPLHTVYPQATTRRNCPAESDGDWLTQGVERGLSNVRRGRDFLQTFQRFWRKNPGRPRPRPRRRQRILSPASTTSCCSRKTGASNKAWQTPPKSSAAKNGAANRNAIWSRPARPSRGSTASCHASPGRRSNVSAGCAPATPIFNRLNQTPIFSSNVPIRWRRQSGGRRPRHQHFLIAAFSQPGDQSAFPQNLL